MDIFVKLSFMLLFAAFVVCAYEDASIVKSIQLRAKRSADTAKFRVIVKEKGSTFTEKIKVDSTHQTVLYSVPAHPGVDRSEVLNVYARNMTVTRLTDQHVCHIRPMSSDEPSPSKIISDMKTVNLPETIRQRGVMLISTQWQIVRNVSDPTALGHTIENFCRGFPIFVLKKLGEDGVQVEITTPKNRQKRQKSFLGFTTCKTIDKYNLACNPGTMLKMQCIITTSTCIYEYTCTVDQVVKKEVGCSAVHKYGGVFCCNPACSA